MSVRDAVVDVMLNAISSMATVSLVSLVGVVCALYPTGDPLMSPVFLRQVARLSSQVFLPALMIYVLGSGLSLRILSDLAILIPFAVLISVVSFVIAHSVGKLIVPEDTPLRSGLIVCCCMPNSTSLPIMILRSACKQPEVNADYQSDQDECETAALSMLFVYAIGWNTMFWAFARHELERCSKQTKLEDTPPTGDETVLSTSVAETAPSQQTEESSLREKLKAFLFSPPMLGIYIGTIIGICAPLQSLLFFELFSPLAPLGDSIETVGEPLICISTLVMAASLAQVRIDMKSLSVYRGFAQIRAWLWPETETHPSTMRCASPDPKGITSLVGPATYELVPGASGAGGGVLSQLPADAGILGSEGDSETAAKAPVTDCADAAMGIGNMLMVTTEKASSGYSNLPSWQYFAFHTLCRLILPPIVILPLLSGAISLGIVGREQRLLALVCVIESCVPSAQLILIVCNQYGLQEMAANISLMYLFHYLISIFTITFWFSVGMLMIY